MKTQSGRPSIQCLKTLVITPQDTLESHLEKLSRKAVGDTQASILTREDVNTARQLLGRKHKLYRGSVAFYLRGRDHAQLQERSPQLSSGQTVDWSALLQDLPQTAKVSENSRPSILA